MQANILDHLQTLRPGRKFSSVWCNSNWALGGERGFYQSQWPLKQIQSCGSSSMTIDWPIRRCWWWPGITEDLARLHVNCIWLVFPRRFTCKRLEISHESPSKNWTNLNVLLQTEQLREPRTSGTNSSHDICRLKKGEMISERNAGTGEWGLWGHCVHDYLPVILSWCTFRDTQTAPSRSSVTPDRKMK